jgi:phenylalanyl-tRNA synthetase alpha chain
MLERVEQLFHEARAALNNVMTSEALRSWESQYLGKKGAVTELVRSVGALPKEERAAFGKRANEIKMALEAAAAEREKVVQAQELARALEEGELDVTLPGRPRRRGGLHPSTQTLRQFYAAWAKMGFQVYHSRDVEDDDTNFTLLNIPPHHPARDMQDTFYTKKPNVILRTHTSPGQIRAMRELGENGSKPIRVILPGMCYRYEQITARSEIQFHQVEGLAIGRHIRMSDLKGTIAAFARAMYGENAAVRFRASYFPFTEPSIEVDVECFLCGGVGCRVCKYSGWLEIAGAGMVHPVVLRNGGYDPAVWSGFAFGMGPERMTMLKHGIEDIRYFWGNDLRFLEQF